MFFHHFTTELKCALFAGSIFMIFFASSLMNVANAEGVQWDNGSGNNPAVIYQPDGGTALNNMENIRSVPPDPNPPDAYGPSNPGGPVAGGPDGDTPPAGGFVWWDIIARFIQMMLGFMKI